MDVFHMLMQVICLGGFVSFADPGGCWGVGKRKKERGPKGIKGVYAG